MNPVWNLKDTAPDQNAPKVWSYWVRHDIKFWKIPYVFAFCPTVSCTNGYNSWLYDNHKWLYHAAYSSSTRLEEKAKSSVGTNTSYILYLNTSLQHIALSWMSLYLVSGWGGRLFLFLHFMFMYNLCIGYLFLSKITKWFSFFLSTTNKYGIMKGLRAVHLPCPPSVLNHLKAFSLTLAQTLTCTRGPTQKVGEITNDRCFNTIWSDVYVDASSKCCENTVILDVDDDLHEASRFHILSSVITATQCCLLSVSLSS